MEDPDTLSDADSPRLAPATLGAALLQALLRGFAFGGLVGALFGLSYRFGSTGGLVCGFSWHAFSAGFVAAPLAFLETWPRLRGRGEPGWGLLVVAYGAAAFWLASVAFARDYPGLIGEGDFPTALASVSQAALVASESTLFVILVAVFGLGAMTSLFAGCEGRIVAAAYFLAFTLPPLFPFAGNPDTFNLVWLMGLAYVFQILALGVGLVVRVAFIPLLEFEGVEAWSGLEIESARDRSHPRSRS